MERLSSRGISVATENPFKTMMLEPPWVLATFAQEIQKRGGKFRGKARMVD